MPPIEFPSDSRRRPTTEEHFVLEDLPERERMLWASLAYLAFPVPVFYARWDPFVRFHVRQGIAIWICWVAASFWHRFAAANEIRETGAVGYGLVLLAICYGIRNALSLEYRGLPWIGRVAGRLPLPKRLAEPGGPADRRRTA